MIIEVPHTYVHTMEQTSTTTLTMINLAQQIFLFLVCLLTFFVPLQSFFLSSLVNMYTKILISQQQEEEWREFAKSWILVLNLHVAAFFEADIVRTAPGYSAKEGSLISDSGPPLVGF